MSLAYFDVYVAQGLKIIPLKENSKIPISKNWNGFWNHDWSRSTIADGANMGILLGSIIDVEGDTPQANKLLLRLTKSYPHPMYSSSKSIHHLFINPNLDFTIIKHQGIEFRCNKHHSVLPPSLHPNGEEYTWLKESRFPIPKLPYSLLALLKQAKKQTNHLKAGHTDPFCSKCNDQCFMHKKRFLLEVEAFKLLGEKWLCQNCRETDVREMCRQIKQKSESRRATNL